MTKRTSKIMKELIRKRQETTNSLSKHIEHNKVNIFDQKITAEESNILFNNIGLELVSKIPNSL